MYIWGPMGSLILHHKPTSFSSYISACRHCFISYYLKRKGEYSIRVFREKEIHIHATLIIMYCYNCSFWLLVVNFFTMLNLWIKIYHSMIVRFLLLC
jgi:hypothetical protein